MINGIKRVKAFDTNGTEGMLDVILSCTLIFILLSCLIQAGKAQSQEKMLPALNLTKTNLQQSGAAASKKNSISIKNKQGKMVLFLNAEQVTFTQLKQQLKQLAGIGHIALRRDKDIPCEWEDKIILLCQQTGINQISIVVR